MSEVLSPIGQYAYATEYTNAWAVLVCEHGGIKFTHLCARWASKALPQCEHSWMCMRTHVWVLLVLFVWCSYEGRMVMCPIVCPASVTVGISLRNRKGSRRNALTRGEDRGH